MTDKTSIQEEADALAAAFDALNEEADAPRFPTMAREHPRFDQSTLPADIPDGFEDVTWCNDTCPSFLNEKAGLIIFVDYAAPEDREEPDMPRFSLGAWDGGSTGNALALSDNWADIIAAIAAHAAERELITKAAEQAADAMARVLCEALDEPGDVPSLFFSGPPHTATLETMAAALLRSMKAISAKGA